MVDHYYNLEEIVKNFSSSLLIRPDNGDVFMLGTVEIPGNEIILGVRATRLTPSLKVLPLTKQSYNDKKEILERLKETIKIIENSIQLTQASNKVNADQLLRITHKADFERYEELSKRHTTTRPAAPTKEWNEYNALYHKIMRIRRRQPGAQKLKKGRKPKNATFDRVQEIAQDLSTNKSVRSKIDQTIKSNALDLLTEAHPQVHKIEIAEPAQFNISTDKCVDKLNFIDIKTAIESSNAVNLSEILSAPAPTPTPAPVSAPIKYDYSISPSDRIYCDNVLKRLERNPHEKLPIVVMKKIVKIYEKLCGENIKLLDPIDDKIRTELEIIIGRNQNESSIIKTPNFLLEIFSQTQKSTTDARSMQKNKIDWIDPMSLLSELEKKQILLEKEKMMLERKRLLGSNRLVHFDEE